MKRDSVLVFVNGYESISFFGISLQALSDFCDFFSLPQIPSNSDDSFKKEMTHVVK